MPKPQSGPQQQFLDSTADIVIYGGAAGGGKTFGLLLDPLRHRSVKGFDAVLFRRTYPQIMQAGGMWDTSEEIYAPAGGSPLKGRVMWRWPAGAKITFAHMQFEDDKLNYQGAQIAMIGWDQLEHFSESMFFYMLSRNRSTCGVRPYIRATCNPDADSWLAGFLAWWIDQDTGFPIPERAGVLRWFVRIGERLIWSDTPGSFETLPAGVQPKSITFIPARVIDNQVLMEKDPAYLSNLMALPPVDRGRLLEGNWKIKAAAGKVFNRAWFDIVPSAPPGGKVCRFWDFAATEKKQSGRDPDFTAGVKIELGNNGVYYVLDCIAEQVGPAAGEDLFLNTSIQDALLASRSGQSYMVRWEEEGGGAGKRESWRLLGKLQEAFARHGLALDASGVSPSGDKLTRAKPLASMAQVGGVKLVAGLWNDEWLRHMHGQPDLPHDDIMDGSSGAYNALTGEAGAIGFML